MLGNEASDRVAFLTDLFPFPRYGPVFVNGWRLCTYPNCDYCTSKPESVILHHDCFKTFVRHVLASNAANPSSPRAVMDRLWRFTAARVPWKDVPDLFLEDDDLSTLDRATVGAVATGHDMPLLQVLPPELVEMVKQRSEDTVFWRITSAVDLANRLADAPVDPAPARTLPMDTIASWRRGEAPIVCEDAGMTASLPIVRLSIDSRGLKSIERYPADSHITSSPRRASSMVFVVEPHTSFDSVLATYQVGIALQLIN